MSLVRVRLETKRRLERLRNYPLKTLDDVITMLLDHYEGRQKQEKTVPNINVILWDEVTLKGEVSVKDFAERQGVTEDEVRKVAERFLDRGVSIEGDVIVFDRVKFEEELKKARGDVE